MCQAQITWHKECRNEPKPSPPQGDPSLGEKTDHSEGHTATGMWGKGAGEQGYGRAVAEVCAQNSETLVDQAGRSGEVSGGRDLSSVFKDQ